MSTNQPRLSRPWARQWKGRGLKETVLLSLSDSFCHWTDQRSREKWLEEIENIFTNWFNVYVFPVVRFCMEQPTLSLWVHERREWWRRETSHYGSELEEVLLLSVLAIWLSFLRREWCHSFPVWNTRCLSQRDCGWFWFPLVVRGSLVRHTWSQWDWMGIMNINICEKENPKRFSNTFLEISLQYCIINVYTPNHVECTVIVCARLWLKYFHCQCWMKITLSSHKRETEEANKK